MVNRSQLFRRAVVSLLGLGVVATLTACSDAANNPDAVPAVPLRLSIRDMSYRGLGEPCSGAGPLLYIHQGANITLRRDGETVLTAKLPVGVSEKGNDLDWGGSPVGPTHCIFLLDATGLVPEEKYEVEIGGHIQAEPYIYDPTFASNGVPILPIPGYPAGKPAIISPQISSDSSATPPKESVSDETEK